MKINLTATELWIWRILVYLLSVVVIANILNGNLTI